MYPFEIETLDLVEDMGVRINVENIFGFQPNDEDGKGEDKN